MKVISVLNQKGGSGKTTIASNLAKALEADGFSVVLIDSDPQGSVSDWAALKEDQTLAVFGISRPTLERDTKQMKQYDFAIIDGAPQAADLAISAIKAADFVLIPVQPSPYDVWASDAIVGMVRDRMQLTGTLKAGFVVSRAITGTKLSGDIHAALAGYELPILSSRIVQRVIYPSTAAQGLSVFDTDHEDAKTEMVLLKEEILHLLQDENVQSSV